MVQKVRVRLHVGVKNDHNVAISRGLHGDGGRARREFSAIHLQISSRLPRSGARFLATYLAGKDHEF